MKNSKSTKRALISSALAILMCVAMLIGTTFAWFTDTASTGVNKIQAGNLDVALEMQENGNWVSAEGKTLQFKTADNRTTDILWEPGCRYELPALRVVNKGNLALKYKIQITGIQGDAKLNEVIDWTINDAPINLTEGHLAANAEGESFTIKGVMQTTAGNEYQGLSIDGIAITVFATQDTVENDSFGNTYDKDATYLMYPSGVTAQSFENATSVEYTNNLGETVTGDKPAVAAYVDSEGNVKYVGDIYAAVKSGATVIYCKQNTTLRMRERLEDTNRSPDLTDNLTIYANGADFQYGEISMNMTPAGQASPITLKVYDAKNIKVWGSTPNDGVTQTIVMENCTNIGQGRTGNNGILMYITGNTGTVNATVKDCYVTANSSGIYMSTNGSLTVTGSTFVDCATGIKTSYKGAGTRTDRIENCVFTNCGCTAEMAGDTAWLKDDSAAYKYKNSNTGTIRLTTKGNTITGTIGDKGDIQIVGNVTLEGDTAFYTLSKFNALTEIPAGIKNVYLNIDAVSLKDGDVTIGNKEICDVWTWDSNTNHQVGDILADGRKVYMVRANDTIYSSNKAGITLYISGSVNGNPEGGLNQSNSHAITFSIPDASNVVFTNNFTVNGYFRMSTGWSDGRNLGGAFYNRTVKSVLFDRSTFNGIWIQNGGFFTDSLTLDGCTFNAYENKVSANDSNPLWFCNIRTCDVTVKNCTFKASRPIKVVEQAVFGANVTITDNKFDMGLYNSANDASKPKNDAIMFSTLIGETQWSPAGTLGNVVVSGNEVTNANALLTFFNPSQITMANGATFKVSDNSLNGAKLSVEWKTATEYTPDFVK